MSAGKVMLGTDGNPLRSADGKIVLADDLYPMVPNHTVTRYSRLVEYDDGVCSASDIWGRSWFVDDGTNSTIGGFFGADLRVDDATNGYCWQGVTQITIGTNAIDWARVKSIKVKVDWAWFPDLKKAGWDCKVTRAMNTGSLPEDTSIRDSWTAVQTFTSATADGTLYVEFPINGVEPTSLEIAFFIDISTCGDTGEVLFYHTSGPQSPRLIYNLATA